MNGQNLTKFYIHIIIEKIYVWIVSRHFFPILKFDILVVDMVMLKVTFVHFTANITEAGL